MCYRQPPPPEKTLEDRQDLIAAIHRSEQLEAKVAELTDALAARRNKAKAKTAKSVKLSDTTEPPLFETTATANDPADSARCDVQ